MRLPEHSFPKQLPLRNDQHDGSRVQAVMLAPDEPTFRIAYFASNFVRGNEWDLPGNPVLVERDILAGLLEAPSFDQLGREVGSRSKDGFVAGYVLIGLFMMWRFPDLHGARHLGGPSLNKAFHFCSHIANNDKWEYGDGSRLPRSETKIKECWTRYKTVAHLWAAHLWNQAFPVGERMSIYREDLGELLSAARYFQFFGQEPLLNNRKSGAMQSAFGNEVWTVPESFRAVLPYDENGKIYQDSPLAHALRSYAAK